MSRTFRKTHNVPDRISSYVVERLRQRQRRKLKLDNFQKRISVHNPMKYELGNE